MWRLPSISTRQLLHLLGFSERFVMRVDGRDGPTLSMGAIGVAEVEGAKVGSTSTTRTTALPSSTRRTLSASHWAVRPEDGLPENASQNAEPSLPTRVCEAIDANIACSGVGAEVGAFPFWTVEERRGCGVGGGLG